jgi:nucleoid DNA-binding protein
MPKTCSLTKAHIVEEFIETNGYIPKKAYEIIKLFLELIKRSLKAGTGVLISGFGKSRVKRKQRVFEVSRQKERI